MRALIWGAGAIGGTIGAYFIRAGHDICFVDLDKAHVDSINRQGLRIEGPIDNFTVQAKAYLPQDLKGQWDAVLLCTKGHHTESAMQMLLPFLTQTGYVVSVQNGLNESLIAQMIGEARTVGSFVNFGADYLEPGVIHYGGRGAVVLGELDGMMTERLTALHQLFLSFDDKAITTSNIWGYLWGKMGYGALLYATALTDASIADALDAEAYEDVFVSLGKEVLAVCSAKGISPEGFNGFNPQAFMPEASFELAQRSIKDMVSFNRKSAKTHSGIYRDLAVRKRKTEADAHLGMMLTQAKELGLEMPLTEMILELIHEIEEGKRSLSWANLERLKERYETHA